jgi:hypothetical protein
MQSTSKSSISGPFGRLLLSLFGSLCVAAGTITVSNDPRVSGGPDMGGGLPHAGPAQPTAPSGCHSLGQVATPTVGLLIDAQNREPLVGAVVVVTDALGEPVAIAVTDSHGKFVVNLYDDPDLELAIPAAGLAGIEIHAGEALLVLVP